MGLSALSHRLIAVTIAGVFVLGLVVSCADESDIPQTLAFADSSAESQISVEAETDPQGGAAFATADGVGENAVDHATERRADGIPPVRGAGGELAVGEQWSVPVSLDCNLAWITDAGERSWRLADGEAELAAPAAWRAAADDAGQLVLVAELESAEVAVFRTPTADDSVRYRRTSASISC